MATAFEELAQEKAGVFQDMTQEGHEQVVFCQHRPAGLRAIIAIHNSTLGPAIGGTRMQPYAGEREALADVLRLARAMTYKAAMAGLNCGGGKAVIVGDPSLHKSEALFRAFGRFLQTLGGRYITATDVGITREDLAIVREETPFVTGLSEKTDTAAATAMGVWVAMKTCSRRVFGNDSLAGRKIVVKGVGKVGGALLPYLAKEGAELYIADVDPKKLEKASREFSVTVIPLEEVLTREADILSLNALGGDLNEKTIPLLRCAIVAGAANNQLEPDRCGRLLYQRSILYAPDYVVNAGGIIVASCELFGYSEGRVRQKIEAIGPTLERVFALAEEQDIPPSQAADSLAEERIKLIGDLQHISLPRSNPKP